jgi:hypothetical protein
MLVAMNEVAEPYAVVRITERTARGVSGQIAAYRATEAEGQTVAEDRHLITGAEYDVWLRPYSDTCRWGLPTTLEA